MQPYGCAHCGKGKSFSIILCVSVCLFDLAIFWKRSKKWTRFVFCLYKCWIHLFPLSFCICVCVKQHSPIAQIYGLICKHTQHRSNSNAQNVIKRLHWNHIWTNIWNRRAFEMKVGNRAMANWSKEMNLAIVRPMCRWTMIQSMSPYARRGPTTRQTIFVMMTTTSMMKVMKTSILIHKLQTNVIQFHSQFASISFCFYFPFLFELISKIKFFCHPMSTRGKYIVLSKSIMKDYVNIWNQTVLSRRNYLQYYLQRQSKPMNE